MPFDISSFVASKTVTINYRYSSFTLREYLCWRHTYCQWPKKKKKVQIHRHARFPRSKKMADLSCSRTNRKRSSLVPGVREKRRSAWYIGLGGLCSIFYPLCYSNMLKIVPIMPKIMPKICLLCSNYAHYFWKEQTCMFE